MSRRKERWTGKAKRVRRITPSGDRLKKLPVEVQGMRILPGEAILVIARGQSYPHVYAGQGPDGYWTDAMNYWTAEGRGPGPYKLEDFRHPDILTGIAKELSKED